MRFFHHTGFHHGWQLIYIDHPTDVSRMTRSAISSGSGSKYVVRDRNHDAFVEAAEDDPAMKLVSWDSGSMVEQITDP